MKQRTLLSLLMILSFLSCKNDRIKEIVQENAGNDSLRHDSADIQVQGGFNENAFREFKLPMKIDTVFILNIDTSLTLTYAEIRSNDEDIFLDNQVNTGLQWRVNEFREIDSIKNIGVYAEYVRKLDIGMMKECKGFKIGKVSLPNGYKMYLWGLDYYSYEACPYFSGRVIFATVPTENGRYHFLLGESSGSGDPPATGSTLIHSILNTDGTIDITREENSDDLDIAGENREIIVCRLKIEEGKNFLSGLKREKHFTETETH